MAESEFLDLVDWDWCQTRSGTLLHACESFDGDDDLVPVGGPGVTVCGVRSRLGIPGMFSRMGAKRCRTCCRRTGFPEGVGSPKNDDALRPLAEARMSRWDGWQRDPSVPEPMSVDEMVQRLRDEGW